MKRLLNMLEMLPDDLYPGGQGLQPGNVLSCRGRRRRRLLDVLLCLSGEVALGDPDERDGHRTLLLLLFPVPLLRRRVGAETP